MAREPCDEIREAVRGLQLELERLRELRLSSRALEVDDELTSDAEGAARAVVFFDDREGKVDARRDAGRRIEGPVLYEDGVCVHAELRISSSEVLREPPVCRDATIVEESRARDAIDACAH